MSSEDYFYFNKEKYLHELKPEMEKYYFAPEILFQFGLVLPYYIPFSEQTVLFYKVNSEEVCHLAFTSAWDKKTIFTGTYSNNGTQIDIKRTRVEVTYIFKNDINIFNYEDEDSLQDFLVNVFDMSLSKVNNVVEAYLVKTKDSKVHKLNKEHFDISSLFRISNGHNYNELKSILFTIHMNAPNINSENLSYSKTNEIMSYVDVVENNLNPFVAGNEFMIEARRKFSYGSYREAIIDAQTSVEIFMYNIYREFLKKEGLTNEKTSEKSEKMRYKSLVEDQFVKRIGGDFNIMDYRTRVGKWWTKTYQYRNKIVHEGYSPSFKECDEAIYHANDVIEYIAELIYNPDNKHKYPDILKYIILNTKE